jgi:anti-sigma-K factor RskA
MSDERTIGPEDSTPVAAEYVLGVLSAQERRDFELRLQREPALVREVEFWEARLGGLASDVRPVAPPSHLWSRIEAAVASESGTALSQGGVWQNLAFWRWAAIGSAAVAAASLLALVYVAGTSTREQPLIARLDMGGGQAGFVAAIDPARNGLTIVPASVTNVNQRVLELWLIAPGDPPRSLGLIEPGRAVHINLSPDLIRRVSADATLAVSVEPPGGSPTGLPTGPVIANGKLTNL